MKLTVLLPVYNGEKYVFSAIESVLSQSYSDFEFLILDDGSNDGTPSILANTRGGTREFGSSVMTRGAWSLHPTVKAYIVICKSRKGPTGG